MIGVRCEVDVWCAVMVDVNDAIKGSCDGCRVYGIGVEGFGYGWYRGDLWVKVWEGVCNGSARNSIFTDLSSDNGEGGECSIECMARRACARVGFGVGDAMV